MIIAEIPKANYCSFFCFLLTMDECIINVGGYTEILPAIKISKALKAKSPAGRNSLRLKRICARHCRLGKLKGKLLTVFLPRKSAFRILFGDIGALSLQLKFACQ